MAVQCKHDSRPLYDQLIDPLRDVARRLGYAIGVHGTLKRDIDLIACPWTRDAVSARCLVKAIQAKAREVIGYAEPHWAEKRSSNSTYFRNGCSGFAEGVGRMSAKPHGRRCWTFHLLRSQDGPYIDLSVMPRIKE